MNKIFIMLSIVVGLLIMAPVPVQAVDQLPAILHGKCFQKDALNLKVCVAYQLLGDSNYYIVTNAYIFRVNGLPSTKVEVLTQWQAATVWRRIINKDIFKVEDGVVVVLNNTNENEIYLKTAKGIMALRLSGRFTRKLY